MGRWVSCAPKAGKAAGCWTLAAGMSPCGGRVAFVLVRDSHCAGISQQSGLSAQQGRPSTPQPAWHTAFRGQHTEVVGSTLSAQHVSDPSAQTFSSPFVQKPLEPAKEHWQKPPGSLSVTVTSTLPPPLGTALDVMSAVKQANSEPPTMAPPLMKTCTPAASSKQQPTRQQCQTEQLATLL